MNHTRHKELRRPVLQRAGIDPRSIDYLLSLELGTVKAVIRSLRELTKTAAWEGREADLAGQTFRYTGGRWCLAR
jgi:hypothetical protein